MPDDISNELEYGERWKPVKPKAFETIDVSRGAIWARNDISGPVCHVGSKFYTGDETTVAAHRASWPAEFVGIDIFPGLNVDVVADLCDPDFFAKNPGLENHFGCVYASALLEHVDDPFGAARNLAGMVRPGGHIMYVGPWVWGYHAYPDDLWRFSFSGIRKLFPGLEWCEWYYSGETKNVGVRINDVAMERKLFRVTLSEEQSATVPGKLSDKALPYLNVGAVGRKRHDADTPSKLSGPK